MFPTSPTMIFSKFLKRKGLPHKKFHALRHTSATLSLIYGIDIKTVGERLGHVLKVVYICSKIRFGNGLVDMSATLPSYTS